MDGKSILELMTLEMDDIPKFSGYIDAEKGFWGTFDDLARNAVERVLRKERLARVSDRLVALKQFYRPLYRRADAGGEAVYT